MEEKDLDLGVIGNAQEYEIDMEQSVCEIELLNEDLQGLKLDKRKFQKGLDNISEFAGQVAGLCSIGCDIKDAAEIIMQLRLNNDTIKHTQDLQKMNNDNALDIAKVNYIQNERNSI